MLELSSPSWSLWVLAGVPPAALPQEPALQAQSGDLVPHAQASQTTSHCADGCPGAVEWRWPSLSLGDTSSLTGAATTQVT